MDMKADLNTIMQEAQKMQERMQTAQKELQDMIVVGEAGAGLVKIEMNGKHDCVKTKINPNLMDEDVEMIEDLVTGAINDAVQKIDKVSRDKIANLTAGLQLPDMDDQKDK